MSSAANRRFTYGAQFSPVQVSLVDLLEACRKHEPDRAALDAEIQSHFFANRGSQGKTLAMNCRLSLNAYSIIAVSPGGTYQFTDVGKSLQVLHSDPTALYRKFATHILLDLDGLFLLRIIENMRMRGEEVGKAAIAEAMNDLGVTVAPNSTYITTMRAWLQLADVFHGRSWEINWDVVDRLLGVDADMLDEMYRLNVAQKHFLLSMAYLDAKDFMPSNRIAEHARNIFRVKITQEQLPKDVIAPLVALGLIESQKTTSGRGAKPHNVRFTAVGQNALLKPLLENLAKVTDFEAADINRPFDAVVADLKDPDTHIRGIALELLAIWIVRLLGLRFSRWRVRNFHETGGAEVDVIAASDKIVYSRWQIQCKNTKNRVDTDTVAKEVGLTFLTKSDIVIVVTTSGFTGDAVNYANQVTDTSRYYVILLDGDDLEQIKVDRARIVDILNAKARRVFARKELAAVDPSVSPRAASAVTIVATPDDLSDALQDDNSDATDPSDGTLS